MEMYRKTEEEFKIFLDNLASEKIKTYKDIPLNVWSLHGWEQISQKKHEEIILDLVKPQIERAKKYMAVYKEGYNKVNSAKINSLNDFWNIPVLIKDSTTNGFGFREKVKSNPYIMAPKDVKDPFFIYKSGGTKGVATPTFLTNNDLDIESYTQIKGWKYVDVLPGDVVLSTYNPTHKGGEIIKRSAIYNGSTFITRRTTEDSKAVIETIKDYNVNVLMTVQPPLTKGDDVSKGGGVNFMSLIEAGQDVIETRIKTLFVTGYKLIDELVSWSEAYNKNLTTVLGSSEAIPQATSTAGGPTTKLCKYNNMHLMNGPHYIEILKEESKVMVPVKKGETGILAYSTLARDGTIYLRYFPGDQATLIAKHGECPCGLKTPIIGNIKRVDHPEDVISNGCCIG